MTTAQKIPFHVDLSRIIDVLARQIYQSPLALLRENCQNAYDAILLRRQLDPAFQAEIRVSITPEEVTVTDNGIGMTRQDLAEHYWRAGSSGKNTPEARAAGVVGTFGIGAMANFGIADTLTVTTQSAITGERTLSRADRATLSATEDCIEMIAEEATGSPGTSVRAAIEAGSPVDVEAAVSYIVEFVRFLDLPVVVNGDQVAQVAFEDAVAQLSSDFNVTEKRVRFGPQLEGDAEMTSDKTGKVWIRMTSLSFAKGDLPGQIILCQDHRQIRAYRNRFALATAAVSSSYGLGGVADLTALEPTAGREALTKESLQLLQTIVTEAENYVSHRLSRTELADQNTGFLQWVTKHGRYDLCGNLQIRVEPEGRSLALQRVRDDSESRPFNYFEGTDSAVIEEFATPDSPLLVLASRNPRRKCEAGYLREFCKTNRIQDAPRVRSRKGERDLTLGECAVAMRIMSILEADYFVKSRVTFGQITHGLTVHVDTSAKPMQITLNGEAPTVQLMLQIYQRDFMALSGLLKDFTRNVLFSKISSLVPSSTREGAEAFLRAIRPAREVFEYEKADLGSFAEIWEGYVSGEVSLDHAIRQSTEMIQTTVQIVDRSLTSKVSEVLPDVLENQAALQRDPGTQAPTDFDALPAITRLDAECDFKLLTIDEGQPDLNGYRCFVAITDRVREDHGAFFFQPHRTDIVWGGQKALFVFMHHSGEFGLYYELQSADLFSDVTGGRPFVTSTIFLKNQIFIPVPADIQDSFIPGETGKKRFEVRCDLLYPEAGA